jgi:transglutaminase-like putative cysteine protease
MPVRRGAWTAAVLALLLVSCACAIHAEGGPGLFVLEGTYRQRTDYAYELTLTHAGGWLEAIVYTVPPIDQPWYRVLLEHQELIATAPWQRISSDENRWGRGWTTLRWNDAPDEIVVTREVVAVSEAAYGPILLADPYPVRRDELTTLVRRGLESTEQIQCDDPTIRAIASAVVSDSRTQMEAVARVLAYVRTTLRYACGKDLCDPVYRVDAAYTLQRGIGNCVCYANATLALLRAADIPCIEASGFVADREESHSGHAWIAVYFPSRGWVEFESADWMPAYREVPMTFLMPQHISIQWGEMPGITRAEFTEVHRASFEILERPAAVTAVEATVAAGSPVAWVCTLENEPWDSCVMTVFVEGVPAGWHASLSETRVTFAEDTDPGNSVDILLTVLPGAEAAGGSTANLSVIAERDGDVVGVLDVVVTVGP